MDKRLKAQGKPRETVCKEHGKHLCQVCFPPAESSKWALERAHKFLDEVLLVDKNSTDMADRAARFSLAREFDAIAADATEKEAVRLGVETHRIIQEHRRERDEVVEKMAEALKPFAEFGEYMQKNPRRGLHNELYGFDNEVFLRQSDLRLAFEALAAYRKAKGE